jgi:pimeloyl-ACP methyl ester carboxylesterase
MMLASRYHQVDGIRIYCPSTGQGDPLLLVHGYLTSHRSWDKVRDALSRRYTVFTPDLPGFGESDRPRHFSYSVEAYACALAGLMDMLGLTSASLIGHSLGGAVVLALAAVNPDRVTRAVAVAPTVYPLPLPLTGRLALLPVVGEVLFKRLFTKRDLRRYFRGEVYLDPQLPTEEMLQYYWERLARPGGREAAYRVLDTLSRLEHLDDLARRVECQVLLVWGERDRLVPLAHGQRLQSELRRASLAVVAGAGHAPMEERPDTFCQHVLEHLGRAR